MTQVASSTAYADVFDEVQRDFSGPARIAELQRRAFEQFSLVGIPTTKVEEWRFTNVSPIAQTTFQRPVRTSASASEIQPFVTNDVDETAHTLVFVNGAYAESLSSTAGLEDGVVVSSLATALASSTEAEMIEAHLGSAADMGAGFTAFNTALSTDGAFIRVPKNVVVAAAVQLLFITTAADGDVATMTHPRVLIVAGEHSQLRLVENYVGTGSTGYLTNTVVEVIGEANAVVDHYKIVRESSTANHIGSMHLRLGRAANFSSHAITLDGGIVRNDVHALLDGEGVTCTLNGLYIANGKRLVDNHTTIHHAQPHCQSYELYKGILDDEAHAVFNGKIIVAIDAQKTDAKQTNKALLLSEDAQINTKPELEIFADDVKCTHGATVGQLDADALFYLRARGLGLEQARSVLVHAFASDLLNHIRIESVRNQLNELLLAQLPNSGGGAVYDHG